MTGVMDAAGLLVGSGFLGGNPDQMDRTGQDLLRQAASAMAEVARLKAIIAALTSTSWTGVSAAKIARLLQLVAQLVQTAESLRSQAEALFSHADTQRRTSAGETVDSATLTRYASPVAAAQLLQAGGVTAAAATGPFAAQIAASRDRIREALDTARENASDARQRLAQLEQLRRLDPRAAGGLGAEINRLHETIELNEKRSAWYQRLLDQNRQIVYFDANAHDGDGELVEIFGRLDRNTRDIGVLLPGTSACLDKMGEPTDGFTSYRGRAELIARASGAPVVLVMRGDLPDEYWDAGTASYANDQAANVASVVHQLRRVAPQAEITALPHSYGGVVFGAAERAGAHFDEVIYMGAPGIGPGYTSASQLLEHNRDLEMYNMTHPNDPIQFVENGRSVAGGYLTAQLGVDPDHDPNITQLPAGTARPDWDGIETHRFVYFQGTGMQNIVNVLTDQHDTPPRRPR